MINICISNNKVTIKGHSCYAEEGKDIVCGGVSALFYALYGYLAKRGCIKDWKPNPGDSYITLNKEGREGLLMFTEGVKMIEDTYPDFVRVNIK